VYSIAKRTAYANVRFVNLFKRHYKPWMNGKVKSVNLQLDRALMECGMSHIGIIDTAPILRKEYTAHDLNSRGERRLTHLIAERISCGNAINVNSIPVIVYARASPFFSLESVGQRCLT
jgi:hypothetical protein